MIKRTWRIHGSTMKSDGDAWSHNLKVTVFAETPEEALAVFRGQFPNSYVWSVSHNGKTIVADDVPPEERKHG